MGLKKEYIIESYNIYMPTLITSRRRGRPTGATKGASQAARILQAVARRSIVKKRTHKNPPVPFPKMKFLSMKWHHVMQLSGGAGTIASQNFSANSLFRPKLGAVTNLPLGEDQLSALYQHYIVPKARITVKICPTVPSASGNPIVWGIRLAGSQTVAYTYDQMVENKLGSFKLLTNAQSNLKPQQLSMTFDMKKFYNIKDPRDNFDELGAIFGDNPNDEAWFQVYLLGLHDSGTVAVPGTPIVTNAYYIDVTIDYTVTCSELKVISRST